MKFIAKLPEQDFVINVGMKFKKTDGTIYMLCRVDEDKYSLIDAEDGMAWGWPPTSLEKIADQLNRSDFRYVASRT